MSVSSTFGLRIVGAGVLVALGLTVSPIKAQGVSPSPVEDRQVLSLTPHDRGSSGGAVQGDYLGAVAPGLEVSALLTPSAASVGALDGFDVKMLAFRDDVVATGTARQLRSLLAEGTITRAEPILPLVPDAIETEGLGLMEMGPWHDGGYGGEGVRIAIVDSGFAGYSELLGVELPTTVVTRSFELHGDIELNSAGLPSVHGTAVAEIVHDVAPAAQLYLVNTRSLSFSSMIDYLLAEKIDVVNMSQAYLEGPFDGSSWISREVQRAVDGGVVWVNSAGNYAKRHWGGPPADADDDRWLDLRSDGVELSTFYAAPGSFEIVLSWPESSADLDVCLFDQSVTPRVMLDCAESVQGPGDRPVEVISWENPTLAPSEYGWAVWRRSGSPSRFDVFGTGAGDFDMYVTSSSIPSPADVTSVVGVGAVHWMFGTFVSTDYSSQGPTVDGRMKPDIVGLAGVRQRESITWPIGCSSIGRASGGV